MGNGGGSGYGQPFSGYNSEEDKLTRITDAGKYAEALGYGESGILAFNRKSKSPQKKSNARDIGLRETRGNYSFGKVVGRKRIFND